MLCESFKKLLSCVACGVDFNITEISISKIQLIQPLDSNSGHEVAHSVLLLVFYPAAVSSKFQCSNQPWPITKVKQD